MTLNYNHLYYFHVAAIEGSIASAAERLGVRQPTVSEQLRVLERTMGFELFERSQAGLRLTEHGRVVFEHSSRMFHIGERLLDLVGLSSLAATKVLRIGVSSALARSTTSDFLLPVCGLDECIPSVRTGDTVELLRELRASVLDLVLCETEPPSAMRHGLQTTLVDQTPLVAVAPPSLVAAPDWHDVGLAHYRAASPYRWEVQAFLDARQLRPRVVAECDDSLFLVEVAARTGCITVVPRPAAREALHAGRLHILADVESNRVAVHALYKDNVAGELSRRAVALLVCSATQGAIDS